jgi:hypothetical protein
MLVIVVRRMRNWNLTTKLSISNFMKIRHKFLELLHGNIQVNRQVIAKFHNKGSNKILKGKREHTNNERES